MEFIKKILNHLMFLNDPKIILDLEKINQWRNRLIHNGNKLPNFILFEFLISQQIIPIVTAIYKAEKNSLMGFEPHYFKTLTGINIIEKLNNANCKFSLTDIENKNYIIPKLFLIGHLKELGRANYSQDFYMMKNIKHDEPGYDNPIGRNVRFAKLEEKNEHFFKRTKCNCCNAESLVVYKRKIDDFFQIGTDFISWFRCFNCDYSLNMNMFDPFEFGLSEEPIFPTC
ncbi:MAG: hypothetical protein FGM14_12540 [Flavobacteriales bacterium]|nr:hypothetical protein [Flavobacteriales bacterium]